MRRILAVLGLLLFTTSAFAADAVCPELSAIQRWAGYLSWMGFLKIAAVVALAVGICVFFYGFIEWAWERLWALIKDVADILAHLVSFALIAAGAWTPEAYQLWPVLGGCLLFGGSVQLTIWLREIKGDDPTGIFALYTAVWGAAAVYYGMSEVGFITVAAFMGVIGFSVAVDPLCYSFGFRKDKDIAAATASALMVLAAYCVERVFYPGASPVIKLFEPGVFWLGSLVGFLGLLILSNKWYVEWKRANYAWVQFITIVCYIAGVAVGMTVGINALAGMAGTFLVFYFAAKFIEIETRTAMGWGLKLMLIGGVFSGAWYFATQNEAFVKTYLTTMLPV